MRRIQVFLLTLILMMLACACAGAEESAAAESSIGADAHAELKTELPPLQDGVYTAYASDEDTVALMGWRDYMIFTVEGGVITDIQVDSLNSVGDLKSKVSKSQYPMNPHPSEWIPELLEQVENAAKGKDIDGISGATISSDAVRKMYDALLQAAETGNTEPIQIK